MIVATVAALSATLLFSAATLGAGLGDIRTMRIPNQLILVMLAGYLIFAPLSGAELQDIALSAATAAGLFVVTFICFSFGWIGGGDAKFATVVALWLGAGNLAPFLLYTALFGGVLTLALLQFRLIPLPAVFAGRNWIARLHASENGVPYGMAIAAAALLVFRDTHWVAAIA